MEIYYTLKDHEHYCAGFYVTVEDGDGNETRLGPFLTKAEALDAASDGAYSEYLADRAKEERVDSYRQDMRDAGRGHLLRDDDF